MAGVETTNNTIGFVISYLVVNQDVQRKVHEEIDRVLGREVLPRITHKTQYACNNIAYFTVFTDTQVLMNDQFSGCLI